MNLVIKIVTAILLMVSAIGLIFASINIVDLHGNDQILKTEDWACFVVFAVCFAFNSFSLVNLP